MSDSKIKEEVEDECENRCVLCFDSLLQCTILRLNCNHEYHLKCWLQVIDKSLCPLCRRLTEKESFVTAMFFLESSALFSVSPNVSPTLALDLGELTQPLLEAPEVEFQTIPGRRNADRHPWRHVINEMRRIKNRLRDLSNFADRQLRLQ